MRDGVSREDEILDAKTFYLAGPVLMPLLERMRKVAFERLMAKYRDGDQNTLNLVAELSVITNIMRDINQKDQFYRTLEEKRNV